MLIEMKVEGEEWERGESNVTVAMQK